MRTIMVHASTTYPVHIGAGLLVQCGALLEKELPPPRACVVVADSNVASLYASRVVTGLQNAGYAVSLYTFPAGEQNKNLRVYGDILEFFAKHALTRTDFVVALGGGVTGDMAGFAAATYQRGVAYVQIPTTFLAASDSSVGGKTAVDLATGKNLVGAFHQPRLVLCDTDTFASLPDDTFADGVAETLKHGLIADSAFFQFLMENDIWENIEDVVAWNVTIKAAVVARDEFEQKGRKLLNFGHTLGHAIEKLSGYTVSHGHAVAIGMVLAARAGERLGYSPAGVLRAVRGANQRYHLPTACPYAAGELHAAAVSDKKRMGDQIDVVVLSEIGKARTVRMDLYGLKAFAEAACAR